MKKLIYKPFDYTELQNDLNDIVITQENNELITKYKSKRNPLITKVSERYGKLDFASFANTCLDQLLEKFQPEKYHLKTMGGLQDLKLIGEEISVNGERYNKMFSIVSSTNKSTAARAHAGLYRQVCTNGAIIAVPNHYVGFCQKHYKKSLGEKINEFTLALENLDINYNEQINIVESLSKKEVSLPNVVHSLMYSKKTNEYMENREPLVKQFLKNVLESPTDRLDIGKLSLDQYELITNFSKLSDPNNTIDIPMNAYNIFNLWTELYNKSDSGRQSLITKNILEIL